MWRHTISSFKENSYSQLIFRKQNVKKIFFLLSYLSDLKLPNANPQRQQVVFIEALIDFLVLCLQPIITWWVIFIFIFINIKNLFLLGVPFSDGHKQHIIVEFVTLEDGETLRHPSTWTHSLHLSYTRGCKLMPHWLLCTNWPTNNL